MNKKHPIYGYVISTKENTQQLLDSGKKFEDFSKEDWEIYSDLSMDEEFIEKYQDKICWHKIGTKKHKISKKFIKNNIQRISWVHISIFQKLSEKFIEEFQDKVDWYKISQNQKLSEKFIEKFQNKVYWDRISQNQKLSEQFIEKFRIEVYWTNIIQYQELSEEFIYKHIYAMKFRFMDDYLNSNKKIRFSSKFLTFLYENEYWLFKIISKKPGFKKISKLIERQIPKLFIEID